MTKKTNTNRELPRGPDALRAANRVASKASIVSLRLVRADFAESKQEPAGGMARLKIDCGFDVGIASPDVRVLTRLRAELPSLSAQSADPELSGSFTVATEYEIVYTGPQFGAATDQDLECFGRVNSLYNVWPFFREFVQSCMMRAHLQPLTLPLLTAQGAVEACGLGLPQKEGDEGSTTDEQKK